MSENTPKSSRFIGTGSKGDFKKVPMVSYEVNSMFYGAEASIFKKAKELRLTMTECEKILWAFLNRNKLMGLKFRSQHPIYKFIADFYCHQIKH